MSRRGGIARVGVGACENGLRSLKKRDLRLVGRWEPERG